MHDSKMTHLDFRKQLLIDFILPERREIQSLFNFDALTGGSLGMVAHDNNYYNFDNIDDVKWYFTENSPYSMTSKRFMMISFHIVTMGVLSIIPASIIHYTNMSLMNQNMSLTGKKMESNSKKSTVGDTATSTGALCVF